MVPQLRKAFNQQFTAEKYKAFLEDLDSVHPGQLNFRVAETPLFIPKTFLQQALDACENIVEVLTSETYQKQSGHAIPPHLRVPGEDAHPHFIAFDFGICRAADGSLEPQLIEMQGFPSLFAFQVLLPEMSQRHFNLPEGLRPLHQWFYQRKLHGAFQENCFRQ